MFCACRSSLHLGQSFELALKRAWRNSSKMEAWVCYDSRIDECDWKEISFWQIWTQGWTYELVLLLSDVYHVSLSKQSCTSSPSYGPKSSISPWSQLWLTDALRSLAFILNYSDIWTDLSLEPCGDTTPATIEGTDQRLNFRPFSSNTGIMLFDFFETLQWMYRNVGGVWVWLIFNVHLSEYWWCWCWFSLKWLLEFWCCYRTPDRPIKEKKLQSGGQFPKKLKADSQQRTGCICDFLFWMQTGKFWKSMSKLLLQPWKNN